MLPVRGVLNYSQKIGLKIPVTIEPVSVVNWMESPRQIKYEYPIIADYTNLCYFRSWRGNKMRTHQPRKRSVYEIAKNKTTLLQ